MVAPLVGRVLDAKPALAYARDRWGGLALPKWHAHRPIPIQRVSNLKPPLQPSYGAPWSTSFDLWDVPGSRDTLPTMPGAGPYGPMNLPARPREAI